MSRSGPVAYLAVIATAILLAPPVAEAQRKRGREQRRPNVLVLMTDDQTLASMEVLSGVRRRLVQRGTTFDRSFVSFSLCCPSRATLFTGQYAHNHTILGNTAPFGGYDKLDKANWLPIWLQRAGYRTIHVGKFLNGYDQPDGVPPGWSEWHGSIDPSTYRYYGYTLNENGTLNTYGADENPAFYSTDFYARRAAELASRAARSRRPFFLSVAFLAPHTGGPRDPDDPARLATPKPAPRHRDRFGSRPLPQPPSFNEADVSDKPAEIRLRPPIGGAGANAIRESYQQRLESLLSVDEGVTRVLRALRAARELDDTLVIFISDNGFFHGEHRIRNGKVLPYEPSIRVPLIMRGPGVPRGARRRQLVTNADLASTILDAAGARAGRVQDGRSLFGLLRDPGREWGRDLLIEGGDGSSSHFDAIRTYRYVFVQYVNGEQELYDLKRDPFQLQSLHADPAYAVIKAGLAFRLAALSICVGRGCRARPDARLRVRAKRGRGGRRFCVARVSGTAIDSVRFEARRRVRDGSAPFRKRVRGRRVRARVLTETASVVTLDRRLPRACR
jgi:N-acetylglucosamine-6-sulfatase